MPSSAKGTLPTSRASPSAQSRHGGHLDAVDGDGNQSDGAHGGGGEHEGGQDPADEPRRGRGRQRPQIRLPRRRPARRDADSELEERHRQQRCRGEPGEQPVRLAPLELAAEHQQEDRGEGDGRQSVRGVSSEIGGLGARVCEREPHPEAPVRQTNASSRLTRVTSSPLNATPERTSSATNASASSA